MLRAVEGHREHLQLFKTYRGMGCILFMSCFKENNNPNINLRSSSGYSDSVLRGLYHSV